MNERIVDLYEQASLFASEEENPTKSYKDRVMIKFAQLIVAECADLFVNQKYMILNPHEPFANERVRALKQHDKDTVKKIKRHFGVEE